MLFTYSETVAFLTLRFPWSEYDVAAIVEINKPHCCSKHSPLVARVRHSPTREGRVFVLKLSMFWWIAVASAVHLKAIMC